MGVVAFVYGIVCYLPLYHRFCRQPHRPQDHRLGTGWAGYDGIHCKPHIAQPLCGSTQRDGPPGA